MNNNQVEYELPMSKSCINNKAIIEFFEYSELFKEFVNNGLFIYSDGTVDNIQ